MSDSDTRKHLVILCGGKSAEHEVSFQSSSAILRHLDPKKYQISALGIQKDGFLYPPETTQRELNLDGSQEVDFPEGRHWVPALMEMRPACRGGISCVARPFW